MRESNVPVIPRYHSPSDAVPYVSRRGDRPSRGRSRRGRSHPRALHPPLRQGPRHRERHPTCLCAARPVPPACSSPRHFGKVHVIAKGIRRATSRMAGHAEPLTHATYQLARGRELDVLTGAEARAIYPELRDDLGRIAAGWYCAELIDRFTVERVPSAPLFDLLETALRHLDAGLPPAAVCPWF